MSKIISPFYVVVIGLCLALVGFFPGYYYYHAKMDNRTVVVKGLSEKDVQADLAIWTIKFQASHNDIVAAKKNIEKQQEMITSFLTKQGFEKNEILVQGLVMQDAYADSYRDKSTIVARYNLTQTLLIRTNQVALVRSVYPNIGNLVSQGVIFNTYGNGVAYIYTQLNKIKPEMLKQATENAFAAAEEFAKTSGAKVGAIRHANQGVFSITGRDSNPGESETEQVNKRVRVVSTVEYFLK